MKSREERNEYGRKYYQKNREKVKEINKKSFQKNIEKNMQTRKIYKENNRTRIRERDRKIP